MPYRLQHDEPLAESVRRVAAEQIDRGLSEIADRQRDPFEIVHQVRKRCKKLRGLLRLIRPLCEETYQYENRQFRDAARELSAVRDAATVCESFEKLKKTTGQPIPESFLADISSKLSERRRHIADQDSQMADGLKTMRDVLAAARARLLKWPLGDLQPAHVARGLKKTYRRGRDAMQDAYAEPSVARFHEWRKRVKYHWYHTRLLRDVWPPVMRCRAAELKSLSDDLGDAHDLAVLRTVLQTEFDSASDRVGVRLILASIESKAADFVTHAHPLGERLFADKPKWLSKRVKNYWNARWRCPASDSQPPVIGEPGNMFPDPQESSS